MVRRWVLAGLCLAPLAAHAEVADKIPSTAWIWGGALLLTGFCVVAARWRAWLAGLVLLVGVGLFASLFTEIMAEDLRGPIVAEQGHAYFLHAAAAAALFLAVALGALARAWGRGARRGQAD